MTDKVEEDKIKKSYSILQKKYSLQSIEELEDNFGHLEFESEKYMLSSIRRRMTDKIEHFVSVLSNVFEGDAAIANIYESKVLDDEKKAELFKSYRRLMKYSRQSNVLSLYYDEKGEAEFIKEFFKEWQSVKIELKEQLSAFRDSWDADTEISDDILNYLG